ncbi:hypothetical protein UT300012_21300 [Paraclostridium bifermentans]
MYDDLDDVNYDIRHAFNSAEKRVYAFTGCVCGALSASPILFLMIIKDNLQLGFMVYATVVVVYSVLFRIIYNKLFGEALEEPYQWGNNTFDKFEENTLNKFYKKGYIDDELFDDYYDEFTREYDEEYEWEYRKYKRRSRKFTIIFTILALAPSLAYMIINVKGMV